MYITLLERKVLRATQIRKGPNKISVIGLAQPVIDGVKLLLNETAVIFFSNKSIFLLRPIIMILVSLCLWCVLSYSVTIVNISLSIIFFLALLGVSIYSSLIVGWRSNSKYSILGRVRLIAQTVSYEIRLSLLLFNIIVFTNRLRFYFLFNIHMSLIRGVCHLGITVIFFVRLLAETRRAPFDFSEGESELVSGFNIELSRGVFALISVSEYRRILFISLVIYVSTAGRSVPFMCLIILSILFVRSVYPRFRYDKLIYFTWIRLLPMVCVYRFVIILY